MNKINVAEAIKMARNGKSLEGFAIEDLGETQVKAKDVLLLSDFGIVVPAQNIYYADSDIEYDPEFDDVEWSKLPSGTSLEQQAEMVKASKEVINISIELEDREVNKWAIENYDKLKYLLNRFVADLYESRTIIEK